MGEGAVCGARAAVFVSCPDHRTLLYSYEENGVSVKDPYAKVIRQDKTYTPPMSRKSGQEPLRIAPEDMIIYKLHVKGFTKTDPSIGEEIRGTFAGLRKKIGYLKKLGINTVELMPVYTFDPILPNGRRNYWGYAQTNSYFAPNAEYAASEDPLTEMTELLHALHKNGIACLLEFYIPEQADAFYVLEALRYWAFEVGADGFHLTGNSRLIEDALGDPYLADRMLLVDSSMQSAAGRWLYRSSGRFLTLQHDFKKAARGFLRGDASRTAAFAEWFRCCPNQYQVVNYICDQNGFTLRDLVSYNEKRNEANGENNRDGEGDNDSWNCGAEGETEDKKILKLRKKQCRNALMMVFLSQGIPMLYAGDEFGNTQGGNNNGYCLDNPAGWLDWEEAGKNADLLRFVRSLIAFRKEHKILHTGSAMWGSDFKDTGMPDISFHGREFYTLESGVSACAVLFNGCYAGEAENHVFFAMNATEGDYEFAVPADRDGGLWHAALISEGSTARASKMMKDNGSSITLTLPPHTFAVLTGGSE